MICLLQLTQNLQYHQQNVPSDQQSLNILYLDIGRCGVSANETTLHPNNNLKKSKPFESFLQSTKQNLV